MAKSWKAPAVPQHVVQMLPVDLSGKLLVMHRSMNVRSARNVWSFPSGMHDIGETARQCAERELIDEYGLKSLNVAFFGQYENIAGDPDAEEQYHWVVTVVGILVEDVTKAINREPEKHDRMEFVPYDSLGKITFLNAYPFHVSFENWIKEAGEVIVSHLNALFTRDEARRVLLLQWPELKPSQREWLSKAGLAMLKNHDLAEHAEHHLFQISDFYDQTIKE